ncbi:MAG: hypothetical protein QOJ15_9885 [Bradyrhizobium sp.]|jgi:hypothetical protein|nr:hypothetical protein [Bradyrhizobium sp.]
MPVEQRPADREEAESLCGEVLQAVVGSDEHEACDRPQTCDMNRDAAAEAAADQYDVGMVIVYSVK